MDKRPIMSQLFTIQNDKIVIDKLELANLEGTVRHTGQLNITGPIILEGYLNANTVEADTIRVKNLVTESGNILDAGHWLFPTEEELNGKGFSWTWGSGATQLAYRTGGRVWISGDVDLQANRSFKIDNTPVISQNALGAQIVKSNLKEVGTLKTLNVTGDVSLSEFATFNSGLGRLGLGTDEPNAALAIVDNDVEIVVGALTPGLASVGTYTNHNLSLITDNTSRITIKNTGEVVIGDPTFKTGNLIVHGTLTVDNLISDTRIERNSSLGFQSTKSQSCVGLGLMWIGSGNPKSLLLAANPDRLRSSESFEVGLNQSYYINGNLVLSEDRLGNTVTSSNLSSLGTLTSLAVQGSAVFLGDVNASRGTILANTLVFNDTNNSLTITGSKFNGSSHFHAAINDDDVIYAGIDEINIGNKINVRRPVKIFGPVSVGINSPDPTVDLSVKGSIAFSGKKMLTGTTPPVEGSFTKGDIVWNQNPLPDNYIGWVCIADGSPGTWAPFGAIARQ
jgi:hypothetical protein